MSTKQFSQLSGGASFINPAYPNVLCVKVANIENRYMEQWSGKVWAIDPTTEVHPVPRGT